MKLQYPRIHGSMAKRTCALLAVVFLATCAFAGKPPQNVILFIGDGMSVPQRMIADEFSRKAGLGSLEMNALPFSAVTRTCSANSLVTDSAAAATAIACGEKTNNGAVGVDANGKRIKSCAETARDAGMKVGVVTTVTITHATPAGFYAHRKNRSETYEIAIDLADSGFDFFAGGGLDWGYKNDKSPLWGKCGHAYHYAESKGYKLVRSRADFLALKRGSDKILTRFRDDALTNAIDVKSDTNEPTLAEMTSKAIELLANQKGFFLMVEGGRIDWAGHANDAATNLRDVLALNEAVKVALDWQKANGDTLVVVTGDHETGGMSMGFAGTGYALYMDRLANQTMSVERFERKFKRLYDEKKKNEETLAFSDAQPLITEAFGFKFEGDPSRDPMVLNKSELDEIEGAFKNDIAFFKGHGKENEKYDAPKKKRLGAACRTVISHKSGIGWSSGAHTAMPVLTTAKGPGAELFSGFIENTDISHNIKKLISQPR